MFRPRRGREFIGRWIGKIEEMQRMQDAGLPVPRWTEITPDLKLDEREWGPAVIVKPSFGGGNREITLMPVDVVRYQPPEEFPQDHRARIGPLIAQQFIHTGPRPVEYRVLTLLGRPLYAVKQTSIDGAAFDWPPTGAVSLRTDVSSKGRQRRIEFTDDPELLALASAVHDSMPDVATVACDIVKDAASGKLFIIEANTKGWGWRLSSRSGREQQKEADLDFYSQFDALSVAADVLIERTRQAAE
jgi:glutathione synthase/RimK-type ligase-like ATP-grasp enzyme